MDAPILRDFFQRHISNRVYFGISTLRAFSLEFHLPYYALRKSGTARLDGRHIRRCAAFFPFRKNPRNGEYLYEAQVSLVVMGSDEWHWMAYCCADTYSGSEKSIQYYHGQGLDAPSGGAMPVQKPVWNPRGYFLLILFQRIEQVTKEWKNVVNTLEDRLRYYEAGIFGENAQNPSLIDDRDFNRTREYTWATELLRLLYNSVAKIIESWEEFASGEIQYLEVDHDTLRGLWESYIAGIRKNMAELRFLRRLLQQRIEMFDNMKNGLVNASTMKESRVATEQGKAIGRLTRVTVAYLPLSLGTAVFSMTIMPSNASWIAYALVLLSLACLTLTLAFRPQSLLRLAMLVWRKLG